MGLKLMYITNKPEVAEIAQKTGVDRIFIDMEYIGKSVRQNGMDTVQSHHTVEDIKRIRSVIGEAELMVRVNPIHDASAAYCSSEQEIDAVIESGADVIMLPYFKTAAEVKRFIEIVGGRAKVFPLVETPEAVERIDEILALPGIDEIHIGLNDLSLGYGKKFMFELLADGTVERLGKAFTDRGIPFGFGGIAALGRGEIRAEQIIMEHYRIGSTIAILSRSFCNTEIITDLNQINSVFTEGVREIRDFEQYCVDHPEEWEKNREEVARSIFEIAARR